MASTFDASGNLLITGYVVKGSAAQTFVLKVDTAGKILAGPLITDPVGSLTNGEGIAWDDTNQEVVIVGACAGTSANTSAAFVARISSDLTKVVSAAQLQGWTSAELTDCVLANGVLIAGGWSQRGDPPRATVVSINANNKITKQLRFDKNYPSNVTVSSMVVQPDGNIFVSIRDNAEQAFHAARFDSSLSADSSFGSITGQPGWATYNLGTAWPSQVTECSVWLNDSIVLGGWVNATRPSGKSDLQTGGKSPKCAIVRIHATAGAADKR